MSRQYPVVLTRSGNTWLATCPLFPDHDVWGVGSTREAATASCCKRIASTVKECGEPPVYEIDMVTVDAGCAT